MGVDRKAVEAQTKLFQRPPLDLDTAQDVIGEAGAPKKFDEVEPGSRRLARLREFEIGQVELQEFPGGTDIERQIGFPAMSAFIDNPTAQFLFIHSARRYVPPYTLGVIVAFPYGIQKLRIVWQAPPGITQPAAVAGQIATALLMEVIRSPATGATLASLVAGALAPFNLAQVAGIATITAPDTADGQGAAGQMMAMMARLAGWNNANFDRLRTASAANLGAAVAGLGALLAAGPGEWAISHLPAANVVATITRAAVAGQRHVCRSITGSIAAGAIAPAAFNTQLLLRDGASGVGAILWGDTLSMSAVAGGQDTSQLSGLNIVGTAGNAMTLEFLAAAGANTLESVALTGYDAT
jgi:hypothetical protein